MSNKKEERMSILEQMRSMKICKVCGDRAIGFNFNGLTCASCRIFFYRNAQRNPETMKCLRNSTCIIDSYTRKCCIKCRLVKCYAIGMRNEDAVKNKLNEEPIKINTTSKTIKSKTKLTQEYSTPNNPSSSSNQENLKILGSFDQNFQQYLSDCSLISSPEIEPQQSASTSESTSPNLELSDFERNQIRLIDQSISNSFEDEHSLELVGETSDPIEAINSAMLYAKRYVKFCKQTPMFRALIQKDQLQVLKHTGYMCFIVRLAYQLNQELTGFTLLENDEGTRARVVSTKAFDNEHNQPAVIEALKLVIVSLHNEMNNDGCVKNLLTCILMCRPTQPLSSIEFVRYHDSFYCHLLRRYLESKYNSTYRARKKYWTLINLIQTDVWKTHTAMEQLLVQVGLEHVDQVVLEIMNLQVE